MQSHISLLPPVGVPVPMEVGGDTQPMALPWWQGSPSLLGGLEASHSAEPSWSEVVPSLSEGLFSPTGPSLPSSIAPREPAKTQRRWLWGSPRCTAHPRFGRFPPNPPLPAHAMTGPRDPRNHSPIVPSTLFLMGDSSASSPPCPQPSDKGGCCVGGKECKQGAQRVQTGCMWGTPQQPAPLNSPASPRCRFHGNAASPSAPNSRSKGRNGAARGSRRTKPRRGLLGCPVRHRPSEPGTWARGTAR